MQKPLISSHAIALVSTISFCLFSHSTFAIDLSNAISAGSYRTTHATTRPLLALTHDGGSSWFYPSTIISGLPLNTGKSARFNAAICNRLKCIASGSYFKTYPPELNVPLFAISQDGGASWNYPDSLPYNLEGEFVGSPTCSGNNCVISGKCHLDSDYSRQLPLLINSYDNGETWQISNSIIYNLHGNYHSGAVIKNTASYASSFIAGGQYLDKEFKYLPLLAQSQDGGNEWDYPASILKALPSDYSDEGLFQSLTCSSTVCIAAGSYLSNRTNNTLPLVAVSNDRGLTWIYSTSVIDNLPRNFMHLMAINQASCSGKNCIIAGQYQSNLCTLQYPFLLSSQNSGKTWSFPQTIIRNLPQDFAGTAIFYGASCHGNICFAVGQYQSSTYNGNFVPLIASSLDGGTTWSYSNSAILDLPSDFANGVLRTVHCNKQDCNAEGQYQLKNGKYYPLIANSHDNGTTWIYPVTVVLNLPIDYADNGIFNGGGSSFSLNTKMNHCKKSLRKK